ncbi:hypothetical protein CEXT_187081 [Caerostris extrusa]|uniref:Uncharacterized protein n=1 Tax=Caerostris extrusa TaxID=172846 RepID=A0AAV4XC68_CAEEX|nr:hypothetical protein CEXT_187081 [Caerostris extrusa]
MCTVRKGYYTDGLDESGTIMNSCDLEYMKPDVLTAPGKTDMVNEETTEIAKRKWSSLLPQVGGVGELLTDHLPEPTKHMRVR